ncbi:MAG: hypothetical protein U0531_18155 [Dehalococcoidia bacterium]
MNFLWFHLMPYRALPKDFSQNYRSVGGPAAAPVRSGHWAPDLQRLARRTGVRRRDGHDAICVNEHHQNAYGLMPSAPTSAPLSLARRTSRSALCVLGNSIALQSAAAGGGGVRQRARLHSAAG